MLHSSLAGLLRLQRVIKAPLGHDAHISIRQVDDRNMRQVLREAKDNKWKNFIIDLSVEKSSMFLRMVSLNIFTFKPKFSVFLISYFYFRDKEEHFNVM